MRCLPPPESFAPELARAMRDAVLSPGKRLRPLVSLASARLCGADPRAAEPVAVALEYIHSASLVLDDLPSMDDAGRRRGQPTLHRVHGVAVSELAAVALLARAFEIVAGARSPAGPLKARIAEELAAAVGASGCCAGQTADLSADPSALDLEALEAIHSRKTGALFVAAVRGGALSAGAGGGTLESLTLFARNLGLAFQITDDLLDFEGDPDRMGKDVRRDAHRANFATIFGVDSSRRLVDELLEASVAALSPFGKRAEILADLARVVRDRRS